MLLISGQVENVTTRKDRTLKITIGANELTPEKSANLLGLFQDFCYFAIKRDDFKSTEISDINTLESDYDDGAKTQSQRIKAVLYVLFKQSAEGFEDFDAYYKHKTEKYIDHLKKLIEE